MSEPRTFTEAELKTIVKEAVKETLVQLGVDAADPIEMQRDFAHLRYWRESTDKAKQHGFIALIVILVTGTAGLIWAAIKGGS